MSNNKPRDTDVPLQAYVELHIAALRKEIEQLREQHCADRAVAQTAIERNERSNDKRFEQNNEFRDAMREQAAEFLPREVYEAGISDLHHRVDVISEKQVSRDTYHAQHEDLRKQVENLTVAVSARSGETLGVRTTIAIGLSIAVFVIGILTFLADKFIR